MLLNEQHEEKDPLSLMQKAFNSYVMFRLETQESTKTNLYRYVEILILLRLCIFATLRAIWWVENTRKNLFFFHLHFLQVSLFDFKKIKLEFIY